MVLEDNVKQADPDVASSTASYAHGGGVVATWVRGTMVAGRPIVFLNWAVALASDPIGPAKPGPLLHLVLRLLTSEGGHQRSPAREAANTDGRMSQRMEQVEQKQERIEARINPEARFVQAIAQSTKGARVNSNQVVPIARRRQSSGKVRGKYGAANSRDCSSTSKYSVDEDRHLRQFVTGNRNGGVAAALKLYDAITKNAMLSRILRWHQAQYGKKLTPSFV
ncbi:hypothetical protein B0H11DRAFT_1929517 [Mycena galericulata]|nr:hypothetical protein B0H11DRAFT_1929517 [Mycena galericulata]